MNEKNLIPQKTEPWRTPFNMFDDLKTEFEQLWQKPWLPFRFRRFETEAPVFMPRVDIYEKDNELVVKADLPGMKKENVQVFIENGDLILKGERKEETEVKEESYYKAECMYGSFYRRLPLSFEVAPDKVNAKFYDGVLEVRLPVPAETKTAPKAIAIN
jgi:HSP20 family protein